MNDNEQLKALRASMDGVGRSDDKQAGKMRNRHTKLYYTTPHLNVGLSIDLF
jgi:hypothetical protein